MDLQDRLKRTQIRKAQKAHECGTCKAKIRIGDHYAYHSQAPDHFGGYFRSTKLCLSCYQQDIERGIVQMNQEANARIDQIAELKGERIT